MGFWDDLLGGIVGRGPKEVDPYAKDREMRMQAYGRAMGDYDRMMSTPGGAIPQAYRDQILGEAEKGVRNANPGAGQSGFTEDRVVRAKNDARVKMLDTELGQLNKQRDYMSSLIGMNQPTKTEPGQTGMLQQVGGQMVGRAAGAGMDAILGTKEDDDMDRLKKLFGTQTNAGNPYQGGMEVGR